MDTVPGVVDASVEATTPVVGVQPVQSPVPANATTPPPTAVVPPAPVVPPPANTNVVVPKSEGGSKEPPKKGLDKKLGGLGTAMVTIVGMVILGVGLGVGVWLTQKSQAPTKVGATYSEINFDAISGVNYGWDGQCYNAAQVSGCIVIRNVCPQMALGTFNSGAYGCNCEPTGGGGLNCTNPWGGAIGPVEREVLVGQGNSQAPCLAANYCGVQQLDVACGGSSLSSFRSRFSDQPPQCVQAATPTPEPGVPTDTPFPTSACPPNVDTQFWYGCTGEPSPGCGGLAGWVDGNVVTNANPTRPFDLDINCFANNGSGTLGDARIELDGPGGRVATVNDAAARDIMISQPGQYTARCVSNADASCYNIDTFNLIQAASPTPTPVTPVCAISGVTVNPASVGVGGQTILSFVLNRNGFSIFPSLGITPSGRLNVSALNNTSGDTWQANMTGLSAGSAAITVNGVDAGGNIRCTGSVQVTITANSPTPTPTGNPTPTLVPNLCQQIEIRRGGQLISAGQIRKGDTITFTGYATGSNVRAIRFTVIKNGVAQAGQEVAVTQIAQGSYSADLVIPTLEAASYSVAITPVN